MTKSRKSGIPTLGGKSGAAMLGAAIGAAMSSVKNAGGGGGPQKIATTKKKKKPAVSNRISSIGNLLPRPSTRSLLGSSSDSHGFRSTSGYKHTPLVLSGRHICATVTTTASAIVRLLNTAGTAPATNLNGFNFDITATAATIANFQIFPAAITALASSFTSWRMRKAVLQWQPTQSTANGGSIAIGAFNAPIFNTYAVTNNLPFVAAMQNSVHCSLWAPATLDLSKVPDASRWINADHQLLVSEADARQEIPFSVFVASDVASVGTWGYLYLDWEIEFKGFGDHTRLSATGLSQPNNEREEERKDDSVQPIGPGISYPLEVREVPPSLSSSSQPSRMVSVEDQTRASGGWFTSPPPARTSLQRAAAQP